MAQQNLAQKRTNKSLKKGELSSSQNDTNCNGGETSSLVGTHKPILIIVIIKTTVCLYCNNFSFLYLQYIPYELYVICSSSILHQMQTASSTSPTVACLCEQLQRRAGERENMADMWAISATISHRQLSSKQNTGDNHKLQATIGDIHTFIRSKKVICSDGRRQKEKPSLFLVHLILNLWVDTSSSAGAQENIYSQLVTDRVGAASTEYC